MQPFLPELCCFRVLPFFLFSPNCLSGTDILYRISVFSSVVFKLVLVLIMAATSAPEATPTADIPYVPIIIGHHNYSFYELTNGNLNITDPQTQVPRKYSCYSTRSRANIKMSAMCLSVRCFSETFSTFPASVAIRFSSSSTPSLPPSIFTWVSAAGHGASWLAWSAALFWK